MKQLFQEVKDRDKEKKFQKRYWSDGKTPKQMNVINQETYAGQIKNINEQILLNQCNDDYFKVFQTIDHDNTVWKRRPQSQMVSSRNHQQKTRFRTQ